MFDAVKLMSLVVKTLPGNDVPYTDFRPAEQHVTIIRKKYRYPVPVPTTKLLYYKKYI
jgi:hypothetical protein